MIVLSINALIFLVISMGGSMSVEEATRVYRPLAAYITFGTLLVIFIGSVATLYRLRGGGRAVAKMVGARQVNPDTSDINERRLVNVVEEMSIIGEVEDRNVIIIDDMVDTAGTLVLAAQMMKDRGARSIRAFATHPVWWASPFMI